MYIEWDVFSGDSTYIVNEKVEPSIYLVYVDEEYGEITTYTAELDNPYNIRMEDDEGFYKVQPMLFRAYFNEQIGDWCWIVKKWDIVLEKKEVD